MPQLSYNYQTPKGTAGNIYDLSPYSADTRINGETTADVLKFGMGVLQGATPGSDVKAPTGADGAETFEGLILSGASERDEEGNVKIYPKQPLAILRYGKAWARIVAGLTVKYGDPLYLVNTGADAGLFTNDSSAGLAINGMFVGAADGNRSIAPVEIYNQKATA